MHNQTNMGLLRILPLGALAMISMIAVVPAAYAQNSVGTITQLTGAANIERAGATIAAAPNTAVMLHDKITTQPNASLTITMVDNSSLQLGASSTLTIDDSFLVNGVGAPSKVGLLGGTLHSVIAGAMRGTTTTFEVHTPNAVGAVRGTEWTENFSEEPRSRYKDCRQFTDVDVFEGTVQVCNVEGPAHCKRECQDVPAGHHVTVACCALFEASTAGLGTLGAVGATSLGAGVAGGLGVGLGCVAGGLGCGGGGGNGAPASASK